MALKEWSRGTPWCTLDHMSVACASGSNFPASDGLGGGCKTAQAQVSANSPSGIAPLGVAIVCVCYVLFIYVISVCLYSLFCSIKSSLLCIDCTVCSMI